MILYVSETFMPFRFVKDTLNELVPAAVRELRNPRYSADEEEGRPDTRERRKSSQLSVKMPNTIFYWSNLKTADEVLSNI